MKQGLYSSITPITPPTSEDDRLSWLRLIRSRKIGPSTFRRLLGEHGTAAAALDALPELARAALLTDYLPFRRDFAEAELEAGQKAGLTLLCIGEENYPPELSDIADAPPLLWARGRLGLLQCPAVAVVGARNASSLGERVATRLSKDLGAMGFSIVSGLARGIDTAAHRAALSTGTIAVFAGGADRVFPPENAALAAQILETGVILSEQPPGFAPHPRHFAQRNRIISGLALGVLLVEAAERSGSLITAGDALDQGREVMAVPGHPSEPRSAGCNQLIRDGATLIRGGKDIEEALGPALAAARARREVARYHDTGGSEGPARHRKAEITPSATPDDRKGDDPNTAPIIRETARDPSRGANRAHPSLYNGAEGKAPQRKVAPQEEPAANRHGPQMKGREPPGACGTKEGTPSLAQRLIRPLSPESGPQARTATSLQGAILSRLTTSPLALDLLIRDLSVPVSLLEAELIALELSGQIERLPGGYLAKTA